MNILTKGEKIAKILELVLGESCGPFGGEDPLVKGSQIYFYTQEYMFPLKISDDGKTISFEITPTTLDYAYKQNGEPNQTFLEFLEYYLGNFSFDPVDTITFLKEGCDGNDFVCSSLKEVDPEGNTIKVIEMIIKGEA